MKINRSSVMVGIFFIAFIFAQPANAQFGAIKKGLVAVKDKIDKHIDINTGTEIGQKAPDATAPAAVAESPKPKKLENGEPGVLRKQLSAAEATAKVQAYLENEKYFRTEISGDTIKTDWSNSSKCPGFTAAKCMYRADVQIRRIGDETVLRIWVEEKRANRTSNNWGDPMKKGEPTAELTSQLGAFLSR